MPLPPNYAYINGEALEGDIISSSPVTMNFYINNWDKQLWSPYINIQDESQNTYNSTEWYVNNAPTTYSGLYRTFPVTFNNSSSEYNIYAVFNGTKIQPGYSFYASHPASGSPRWIDSPEIRNSFRLVSREHRYTFNKLPNNYALPQFNYYIEGLDTKVNFSVEVKQYINPVPNTYNIGDIASDSNNNYWIVARDNTGSSVWKSINIRDLYSSSLVYDLGDLIVNPDDSIDVMYRTDNNIWKRIGTLKI